MSGDNTTGIVAERAYKRLIAAILAKMPSRIIEFYRLEAEEKMAEKLELEQIKAEAEKYLLYYQCGRCVLINKESPLGKKILTKKKKEA